MFQRQEPKRSHHARPPSAPDGASTPITAFFSKRPAAKQVEKQLMAEGHL